MKITRILFILFFVSALTFAQKNKNTFDWNGYAQFRLYKTNNSVQGFRIRRAKLWVKGKVPKADSFTYKVMGIFKYNKTGYFSLLDVFGNYNFSTGYLRFGQQIPEFSLQREQPDWKIPVVERASIINKLIPAAQSNARDIGVQVHLNFLDNNFQIATGIFNGNGANLKKHSSANFLYSLRSFYKIKFSKNYWWHIGTSLMYRKANNTNFSLIFGKDNLYSGDDFRFGFESLLKLNNLEIQAEYIKADFNGSVSYGYYVLANYIISTNDQVVISSDQLIDLNKNTDDAPWLNIGYNHLFTEHKLKLMINGGTQFNDNFSLTAQMQLFFN